MFTNTVPVDAYRGAGRPEATYVVERLVRPGGASTSKLTAGRDPPPQLHPPASPTRRRSRCTTTRGNYEACARRGDAHGRRQAASRRAQGRGGQGAASCAASATRRYIEACGLAPSNIVGALGARAGLFEAGEVRVHPTGNVTVLHRLAQPRPGPRDDVRADRRRRARHRRSTTSTSCTATPAGCRSAWAPTARARWPWAAPRSSRRCDKIVAKGKKIAAHLLEAAETDIEFDDGKFTVAGTDRSKTFGEVALTAYVPHNYPLDKLEPGLERDRVLRPDELHLSGRHAHLRGRDRPATRAWSKSSRSPPATTSATSSTR